MNVHPNKLEVRFQNEPAVAEAVRTLVSEAMRGETLGETACGGAEAPLPTVEPKADFSLVRLDNPLDGQAAPPGAGGRPAKRRGDFREPMPRRSRGTRC